MESRERETENERYTTFDIGMETRDRFELPNSETSKSQVYNQQPRVLLQIKDPEEGSVWIPNDASGRQVVSPDSCPCGQNRHLAAR